MRNRIKWKIIYAVVVIVFTCIITSAGVVEMMRTKNILASSIICGLWSLIIIKQVLDCVRYIRN